MIFLYIFHEENFKRQRYLTIFNAYAFILCLGYGSKNKGMSLGGRYNGHCLRCHRRHCGYWVSSDSDVEGFHYHSR